MSKSRYFGYMIQGVSLTMDPKRVNTASSNSKQFLHKYTCIICLTTLLIFMTIFEPETWIKQLILSILSELENHNYTNKGFWWHLEVPDADSGLLADLYHLCRRLSRL